MLESKRIRLVQKGFPRPSRPAERAVAVREAAKARDDRVMALGIVERAGESRVAGQRGGELDAQLLIGEVFAVLEGQIDKLPPSARQRAIEAARQSGTRGPARRGITGEGLGAAAKEIVRQLIEQQDQREARLGFERPIGEAGWPLSGGC